jgi:hypothetical protein
MSESSTPPELTKRRHTKGRRSKGRLAALGRFWREWWVEILVALLIAFAIFLLVEQMDIRQTLFAWLVNLFDSLGTFGSNLVAGFKRFVRNTTLSDLTAYGLIVIVLGLVVWRARWRLMTSPRWTTQKCPLCGSELHRIRRRTRDRIVNLLVPVRRYRCKSNECHWQGLRVGHSRHE